ncbi:hypothetical protein [Chryseobacterium gleum]|uniref:hypothetical protein n=1 Tax=Chryseobacterium gleum TaxID=250 RepID=UPI001E4E4AF8|nr:hypothetical protein [Chryseobacterium gleum]MCD9618505.1 hypothetical protein [Chryseobacterium gleum]MCE4065537.1 hypothetical protein [Chryseobacterium gleum]
MKFIIYHSSFIINDSFPSPDRNGYPTAGAGAQEGLSVGERWREEYEWIAGLSSEIKRECWRVREFECEKGLRILVKRDIKKRNMKFLWIFCCI